MGAEDDTVDGKDELRRRHRAAHERAADTHDRARETALRAAALFDSLGDADAAMEQRAAAARHRLAAEADRRTAEEPP